MKLWLCPCGGHLPSFLVPLPAIPSAAAEAVPRNQLETAEAYGMNRLRSSGGAVATDVDLCASGTVKSVDDPDQSDTLLFFWGRGYCLLGADWQAKPVPSHFRIQIGGSGTFRAAAALSGRPDQRDCSPDHGALQYGPGDAWRKPAGEADLTMSWF